MDELPAPGLELAARFSVEVGAPVEIGDTGHGLRRLIPILGGSVGGPLLRGRVLAGGADFQTVEAGGVARLEARYALELDDGTRVYVVNHALRRAAPEVTARLVRGEAVDPALVYFRCAPRFEVGPGPWRWLAEHVFLGTGVRRPATVEMAFFIVR